MTNESVFFFRHPVRGRRWCEPEDGHLILEISDTTYGSAEAAQASIDRMLASLRRAARESWVNLFVVISAKAEGSLGTDQLPQQRLSDD